MVSARVAYGGILVPARIDLHPVTMQVDTGATTTLVDSDAAIRLSLPADPHRRTTVRGIGGQELTQNALVQSLEVGGQEWQMLSLATGHRPAPNDPAQTVAGVLGADRLAAFDVELDLPDNRMTLWQVSNCDGDFALKNLRHYTVPLLWEPPNRLIAHVELNGHPIEALVDWGAVSSTVTTAAAANIGISADAMATDRTGKNWGIDDNENIVHLHRFETLRLGAETFHQPMIGVANLHLYGADMLLGIDFARRRHIWLSYATHQMFIVPAVLSVAQAPMS